MNIGYARVSTDSQILDLQLDALSVNGCETVYQEHASGKNTARPELENCLKALRAGDTLTVWRLDRLGRSLHDLTKIVNDLETRGVGFASLTEQINTTSPSGKLVFQLFGALAEFEKNLIAERNTRQGGVLYKIKDDPRRMKVGVVIERYSLDELPQFFNVLKGDMSLVGPRPHQEREVDRYAEYHRRLLTIKPGVTGMAQVSGRSDLAFEDEYRLDVFYIENWSLWMDVLICLKTAGALLKRRKNNGHK